MRWHQQRRQCREIQEFNALLGSVRAQKVTSFGTQQRLRRGVNTGFLLEGSHPITTAKSRSLNADNEFPAIDLSQLREQTGITLLVTNEAAALLRLRPQTMRRWACDGSGPIKPRRIAGRLRWPLADIKALLAGESVAA